MITPHNYNFSEKWKKLCFSLIGVIHAVGSLALLGGLTLGALVCTRYSFFGKITGISGMLHSTVSPEITERSYDKLFICGVILGGSLCSVLFPNAFEDWTGVPLSRIVIGGLLVGFGTRLGSGCTSGHGVCGLSSFKLRSFAATMTFMTTGFITATTFNTSQFLPVFDNTLDITSSLICSTVVAGILSLFYLSTILITDVYQKKYLVGVIEFVGGGIFAIAMSISNMTKLSATISFLDLNVWNPALMFVMGGSIVVSAPFFYYFKENSIAPLVLSSWSLPTLTIIDLNLLVGAAMFGTGWGLVGACPGPAIVNLLGNSVSGYYPIIYFASVVVGMWVQETTKGLLDYSNRSSYTQVVNPVNPVPSVQLIK